MFGQLRKKVSEVKGQILLITDGKGKYTFQLVKVCKQIILQKQLISNLHAVAPFYRNFFNLLFD